MEWNYVSGDDEFYLFSILDAILFMQNWKCAAIWLVI